MKMMDDNKTDSKNNHENDASKTDGKNNTNNDNEDANDNDTDDNEDNNDNITAQITISTFSYYTPCSQDRCNDTYKLIQIVMYTSIESGFLLCTYTKTHLKHDSRYLQKISLT